MDPKKDIDIKEDYIDPPPAHFGHEAEKLPHLEPWRIVFISLLFIFVLTAGFSRSKSANVTPLTPIQNTPTTYVTENNGWKTYANRDFGFLIKYPDTYTFYSSNSNDYISLQSPLEDIPRKGYAPTNNELKIELYINSGLTTIDKSNLIEEYETMLSGKKATYSKWTTDHSSGETIQYYDNNRTLSIQKYPLETSRQQEFEQILSTFTFLDEGEPEKCLPYVNPCDPQSCNYNPEKCNQP